MGVKGLQTYVEKHCPAACKIVSLRKVAFSHKVKFNCDPVLVVDGMNLAHWLYSSGNLDWIYGGQWLQYLNLLAHFIKKFRNIGVELIFFFDGTVCESKMDEWVRRRIAKCKKIASIFYDIKSNCKELEGKHFLRPIAIGLLTAFALKELSAKVYQTYQEADDEIAKYAHESQEVFGILSQDSDFIIYNTKPYYSLEHLDLDTLRTLSYDRDVLASHLKLDLNQLRLFACLVGNHFVPSDKLKDFHLRLTKNEHVYLSDIARQLSHLIKKECWTGNPVNEPELNRISYLTFGDQKLSYLIRDGLKSYVIADSAFLPPKPCISISPDFEKAMYARHLDCTNSRYIFDLLCKLQFGCSEVYFDKKNYYLNLFIFQTKNYRFSELILEYQSKNFRFSKS